MALGGEKTQVHSRTTDTALSCMGPVRAGLVMVSEAGPGVPSFYFVPAGPGSSQARCMSNAEENHHRGILPLPPRISLAPFVAPIFRSISLQTSFSRPLFPFFFAPQLHVNPTSVHLQLSTSFFPPLLRASLFF